MSGSVIGFHHNNGLYYFQKNLQGDVIRILDTSGTIVTEYKYDARGNILSITGTQADTIGQYNPFRYRGYYYDTETGFYYLNSRYYDPQVGRFINADGIIGANGGIMGYNMFAYCNNNPVMYSDPSGMCSILVREDLGGSEVSVHVEDVPCGSDFFGKYDGEIIDFLMCYEYEQFMDFIILKEQFSEKGPDLEGDTSIGYGHKIFNNDSVLIKVFGTTNINSLSMNQARLLLWGDICNNIHKVNLALKYTPEMKNKLNTRQFLSLVSIAYNGGYKGIRDVILPGLNYLTSYNIEAVLPLFIASIPPDHENYEGLVNRRTAEAAYFMGTTG